MAPFLERLRPRGVRRGRAPLDQGRRWRRAGRGGPPPAAARLPGTRVGLRARRTQLWAASAHRPAPRLLGRLRRHGAGLCPGRRALPPGCSAQRPGRLPGPPPAPADPRHALPSPRRGRPHARCAALVGGCAQRCALRALARVSPRRWDSARAVRLGKHYLHRQALWSRKTAVLMPQGWEGRSRSEVRQALRRARTTAAGGAVCAGSRPLLVSAVPQALAAEGRAGGGQRGRRPPAGLQPRRAPHRPAGAGARGRRPPPATRRAAAHPARPRRPPHMRQPHQTAC